MENVVIQWTCPNCDTTLISGSWHTPDITGCLYGNHTWHGEDITDLANMRNEQYNKTKKN